MIDNFLAEVPNYFVFIGAYGPLGHGSVVPMVEFYTNYIIQVLEKFQTEDIKKIQVKKSAAEAFTRHADQYLKRTAWTGYVNVPFLIVTEWSIIL